VWRLRAAAALAIHERVHVRLHVEVDGTGPTVVLAHGFAGSARNLGPQARVLRERYRVVRYDARGHARSEAPDDPAAYTLDALVEDLAAVLDRVGAADAIVGGVSMGAMTALAFTLAHPERVCGLVVAALLAPPENGTGLARVALAFADVLERDGLEAAGARYVWGAESGLDARGARLVRQGFLEHSPRALARCLRGIVARWPALEAWRERLERVAVPVLIVAGGDDGGALTSSRALAAMLPRSEVVVIPDAGHLVNLEQPARFNAALLAWLAAAGL
jgi:pimeloyl-ACP methyl ester carboxylesterase